MMEIEKLDVNAVCFGILCNFPRFCGEERAKEAAEFVRSLQADNERLKAQVPRWIPVEGRLPEEGKRCLLYTPCDGIICVGFYGGNDNWEHRHKWKLVTAMRSTQTLTKKVTHWMPLPKPPKEAAHD